MCFQKDTTDMSIFRPEGTGKEGMQEDKLFLIPDRFMTVVGKK